jgi:hypothetical protein
MPIRTLIMLFINVFIGTWIGITLIEFIDGWLVANHKDPNLWMLSDLILHPEGDPYRLVSSLAISLFLFFPFSKEFSKNFSKEISLQEETLRILDFALGVFMTIMGFGIVYLISIPSLLFLQFLYYHIAYFPFFHWGLFVNEGFGLRNPDEFFFLKKCFHYFAGNVNQNVGTSVLWPPMTSHVLNHVVVCFAFFLTLRGLLNFRKQDDSEWMMSVDIPAGNPKAWRTILDYYKITDLNNLIAKNRFVFMIFMLLWLLPTILTNTLPFTDPNLLLDFSGRVISDLGTNYADFFELPQDLDRDSAFFVVYQTIKGSFGLELYLHLLVTRGFILFTILLLLAFIRKKVAEFSVWTRR